MRLQLAKGSWAVLVFAAVVAAVLLGHSSGQDVEPGPHAALIKQLADPKFANREAATNRLVAQGEAALPSLRRAATTAASAEIRRRAQTAVRRILQSACKSPSIGLELVVVTPGEIQLGSPRFEGGRGADEQQHPVRIPVEFLVGAYEVTQDEYQRIMKVNPSGFAATGVNQNRVAGLDTKRFPVERVTWFDAVEFCNRLSEKDGYAPHYKLADVKREGDSIASADVTVVGGPGYRLPTEAEWEYACRAWSIRAFHFGGANTGKEANLKPGPSTGYGGGPNWVTLGRTTRVGSYPANHLGLYDMHGNAAEWCSDWYDAAYYPNSPLTDPKGPATGKHRVLRGGSYLVNEHSCRSAARFAHPPNEIKDYAGFRVARTP